MRKLEEIKGNPWKDHELIEGNVSVEKDFFKLSGEKYENSLKEHAPKGATHYKLALWSEGGPIIKNDIYSGEEHFFVNYFKKKSA